MTIVRKNAASTAAGGEGGAELPFPAGRLQLQEILDPRSGIFAGPNVAIQTVDFRQAACAVASWHGDEPEVRSRI